MQGAFGQLMQALVGGAAGVGAVDAAVQAALGGVRLFAEQALALHVRAQADGAQRPTRRMGNLALCRPRRHRR